MRQWLLAVGLMATVLGACSDDSSGGGGGGGTGPAGPVTLQGAAQKGPLVLGSTVQVSMLDPGGNPTGQVFNTSTLSDLGDYTVVVANPGNAELIAQGFYFNEVTGALSGAPITLHALASIAGSGTQQSYLNVVTHMGYRRVLQLHRGSSPLPVAVAQAEDELRTALGVIYPGSDAAAGTGMNLLGGDTPDSQYLFALSCMLAAASTGDAQLQELLNNIAASLEPDGQLEPALVQQLVDAEKSFDPATCVTNLQARIDATGSSAVVPDINQVWDTDKDGLPNATDPDDDNDGFEDVNDCAPLDPSLQILLADGVTCVADGPDWDGDGVPNAQDCAPLDPALGTDCSTAIWSKRFGDVANNQYGMRLAVDALGNVVVAGQFYGTVDFGGGALTDGGNSSIFLAKFDGTGTHLWSKSFGGPYGASVNAVAVDPQGSVTIAGSFRGDVDFGGGALTAAQSADDVFVAKYDSNGNHLWSESFGDAAAIQYATSLAVNAAGDLVVTGQFFGAIDFGGGPLTSVDAYDAFLVKLDSNGAFVWSKSFGGLHGQSGDGVAFDNGGNLVLTGTFDGTVDFGGGPLSSLNDYNIFVAKLDSGGNHIWSQGFGGTGDQAAQFLAFDASDDVLVTGVNWGTVDFGGGPLTTAGNGDIFVVKLDAGGNHLWSTGFGGAANDIGRSVAVDVSGNVLVTGTFMEAVDFGGELLTSAGLEDIFVVKLDAAGNHLWSKRFGDVDLDSAYAIAADGLGDVLLTGEFRGTVDFGGNPLTSLGGSDIFLTELPP
jgi:hypothetical protein